MPCGGREENGYSISKGQIFRFGVDLDGNPITRTGTDRAPPHYFIILSHFRYNSRLSKKSCLGVGLSSGSWDYTYNLFPEHFENWSAISGGYYNSFKSSNPLLVQVDKVCRLCYDHIEMPTGGQLTLKLNQDGLRFLLSKISYFLGINDSEES